MDQMDEVLLESITEQFITGVRKHLQNPQVMNAPAFSWDEDPHGTIFDGTAGVPVEGYEGLVLVFFKRGSCMMQTWIERNKRNWKVLGA